MSICLETQNVDKDYSPNLVVLVHSGIRLAAMGNVQQRLKFLDDISVWAKSIGHRIEGVVGDNSRSRPVTKAIANKGKKG